MKKRLFLKNTWYNSLLNYIPKPIKTVGGVKDKNMVFIRQTQQKIIINQSVSTICMELKKKTRKPKIKQKQAVDNIITNERWRNIFRQKRENKAEQSNTE